MRGNCAVYSELSGQGEGLQFRSHRAASIEFEAMDDSEMTAAGWRRVALRVLAGLTLRSGVERWGGPVSKAKYGTVIQSMPQNNVWRLWYEVTHPTFVPGRHERPVVPAIRLEFETELQGVK